MDRSAVKEKIQNMVDEERSTMLPGYTGHHCIIMAVIKLQAKTAQWNFLDKPTVWQYKGVYFSADRQGNLEWRIKTPRGYELEPV